MNSFGTRSTLKLGPREFEIYRLDALEKQGLANRHLPFSLRILLENLLRTENGRSVTADDIRELVPNAQVTTIFALVGALGRGDRKRSFDSLEVLLREGEYLPLALTFLATQFRLAKVAQEERLRNAQQIQAYFTRQGLRIWRDRAEQIQQTLLAFSKERLDQAIEKVFWADKALRDARPDDRLVMEELLLSLTARPG